MSAPPNWPNPELPGYPMFPERDGWHMTTRSGVTSPTISFWRASEEVWKSGSSSYTPDYLAHPLRKYIGPCLTPKQIAEMLAGERKRIATWVATQRNDVPAMGEEFAAAIRNLGAAS